MPGLVFALGIFGMLAGAAWVWRRGRKRDAAWIAIGAFPVAFVLMLAAAIIGAPGDAAQPDMSESECRADIECFRQSRALEAAVACQNAVADRARFTVEWMDGDFSALQSFPVIAVSDMAAGTLMLTGDRARFQNGFGAMQRMRYACEWNEAGGVVDVTVEPAG